jgi:hypothetical protein
MLWGNPCPRLVLYYDATVIYMLDYIDLIKYDEERDDDDHDHGHGHDILDNDDELTDSSRA